LCFTTAKLAGVNYVVPRLVKGNDILSAENMSYWKGSTTMAQPAVDVKRWTREEYERLAESGFFHPDERVELIDGIIYEMSPQTSRHSSTISAAQEILQRVFLDGFSLRIQMPLNLNADSQPEPDLAVVPGHWRDYLNAHPTTAVLLVEVSDSSLHLDREAKRVLYAEAQIPEYWILDTKAKQLEVFHDPSNGDYRFRTVLKPGDSITPLAAPDASIPVADLLP
jgi:Uma2 family endonuclease